MCGEEPAKAPGACATAIFAISGASWLPDNRVRAIWSDANGRAWLETDGGLACIEERPTTLAQKAAHFDQITQERHNRRGFICAIDLVADDAEKKEIAAVVRRVTDHIIDHGLTLVDHTGVKTRWGIWAPELINRHPFYYERRPLNSIEILAFLKVAQHITGDARYARVFNEVIEKHHYLLNSLLMRRSTTGQWPDISHSDDELLYLVYCPLLRLEKDPSRRRILTQSITRTWEDASPGEQPIRPEHSPFYNFVYGATTGRRCDVEEAIQTLEDWPWDLFDWATRGSHRTDVQVLTAPGFHRQRTQLNRVLPISERAQGRWNSSPWIADGGSNGRHEHHGVAWSLGYWLGVYHGYLPM